MFPFVGSGYSFFFFDLFAIDAATAAAVRQIIYGFVTVIESIADATLKCEL